MFCVVIPTFNEAPNIEVLVKAIETEFSGEEFRVIIVDDDSPDGTASVANQANGTYGNIVVHSREAERGLGTALDVGIRLAMGFPDCAHIVTMDGDLSHDPKDIRHLLAVANKADLVQGSRYLPGGKVVGLPLRRRLLSNIANILCRTLLATGLHENTTNFRVYSRTLAELVLKCSAPVGYEFMLLPILIARQARLPIIEVGITFRERQGGASKMTLKTIVQWGGFLVHTFWRQRVLRRQLIRNITPGASP